MAGEYVSVWLDGKLRYWGTFVTAKDHVMTFLDYSTGVAVERKVHSSYVHWTTHGTWDELQGIVVANWVPPKEETPAETLAKNEPVPQVQTFHLAVTGHRPDKFSPTSNPRDGYKIPNPYYDLVMLLAAEALQRIKPDYVLTGMSLGFDQWIADLCVALGIPFVAALPFAGQEQKWPPQSQAKYHLLLSKAYAKYIVCAGGYESWKMQKRNEWMVDSCHKVLAAWNGSSGGTANCITYAQSRGKDIEYLKIPHQGVEVGEFFYQMQQMKGAQPQQQTTQAGDGTKRIVEI